MPTTLVTGATRGIGREVARRLVEAGHTVYLGARDLQRGAEAAETVGASALQLDVTDPSSIADAVRQVQEEAGALDVLVNNAGIAGDQRPPGEASIEDLRTVLETNVLGAAAVLDAFTPLLDASEAPVVVNVSSRVGSLTLSANPESRWPAMLAYPMSKAALNMLTIQYARAHPRWRVNAATPGVTETEFVAPRDGSPTFDQLREAGVQVHTVEEGSQIIVQLATAAGDGPTGDFVGNEGLVPW